MKNHLVLFFFLASAIFSSSCKVKTKSTERCGDGFIDPAEDCDGDNLNNETCASLGHYNQTGQLTCDSTCRFNTNDCGSRCGDNVVDVEYGEECDGENLNGMSCQALNYTLGGTLSCSAGCRFDTSQCQTTCGNGNLEPGEACDDGNTADGDGCSVFCTVEEGWTCSGETRSVCTPFCKPGLTYCNGDCPDLANDPGHCGACGVACDSGELCVGSVCRALLAPWSRAGRFPGGDESARASRFAASSCGGGPVIWIHDYYGSAPYTNYQLNISGEQLFSLTTLAPLANPVHTSFGGMDMTCQGAIKIAAFNLWGESAIAAQRLDNNGQWNSHTGGVELTSSCMGVHHIRILTGEPDRVHVLNGGSGGCGSAIEYAWWDGSAWQGHPSMGDFPRQVSGNSLNPPVLSVHGTSFVIAAAENTFTTENIQFWTWGSGSWVSAMPDLSFPELTAGEKKLPMELVHAPDGRLCTAIQMTEQSWVPDPSSLIRVFCEDPDSGEWVELANGLEQNKKTCSPSMVFAGDQLYMAFSQKEVVLVGSETRELWRARVVRWDPVALAWENVGPVPVFSDIGEVRQLQLVNQEDHLVLFLLEVWHEEPEGIFPTGNLYVWKP